MTSLHTRASALLRRMQFASDDADKIAKIEQATRYLVKEADARKQTATSVAAAQKSLNAAINQWLDAAEAGSGAGSPRNKYDKINAAITSAIKAVVAARQELFRFS